MMAGGTNLFSSLPCRWCSTESTWIYHSGPCPHIKAIEYFPDGTVKRVEFSR